MEGVNKGLTRRGFLRAAATGVAGAGVLSVGITGCAPSSAPEKTAGGEKGGTSGKEAKSPASLNPQDYDYRNNSGSLATVLSGIKIGQMELTNRMVKSAAGSDTQKNPSEMVAYYANFAKGGIDLIWVEDCVDLYEHYSNPRKAKRDEIPFKDIVDSIHSEGAYAGYQLSCMGYGFSGTQKTASGGFDSAVAADLTLEEIISLQADFISAAKYLQDTGFDAVEINAAGNNLGQSFFSRMRNKRDDNYGPQSIENRARFVSEIVKGIKETCGSGFAVQVLINAIEENDTNLGDDSLMTTVEENIQICKLLEEAGMDSLHARLGPLGMHVCQFASDLYFTGYGIDGTTGYGNQFDFSRHWQGKLLATHSGCGMMLDVAKEFKDALTIPVGTVTFMDPAPAPDLFENALKDGKADFYLMNRPLTVDPEYPNKLKEGKLDEIAPCTRCMHCHFDYDKEGKIYEHCRVNATTQRAFREQMPEGFDLVPAEAEKKVMVVGAGPAGMEAARIAAQRGHKVTLYEKKSSVGGLLSFAAAVKGPHENLDSLRTYLEKQLELSGVNLVTDQEVDLDFVKGEAPDVVVLAAGGQRDSLGLTETSGTKIVPLDGVMNQDIGENIVVVGSNAQAVDAVLYLLASGKKVTIVTPDAMKDFDKGQSNWVKTFVKPMIFARGCRVWPNAKISQIEDGSVVINGETGVDITIPCDTIVEAMDMLPNMSIMDSLTDVEAYAVGDCSEPWNIADAITTANLIARKI